jgi:ligand-binding SRPBCC domain-containing protein
MKLRFETAIPKPFEKIRDHFNRELFTSISPAFIPFNIKRFDGCKKGDEIHIDLGPGFASQSWVSLITFEETNASGWSFIDEGKVLPWPLLYWKHHHRVDRMGPTESKIVDDIEFECSPQFLTPLMRPFLWTVFAIRPARYKKFFQGNL